MKDKWFVIISILLHIESSNSLRNDKKTIQILGYVSPFDLLLSYLCRKSIKDKRGFQQTL